jgi:hypothetical protein
VLDATGSLVGAVGIVDLTQFIPPDPTRDQIKQTLAIAGRVSKMLGYKNS